MLDRSEFCIIHGLSCVVLFFCATSMILANFGVPEDLRAFMDHRPTNTCDVLEMTRSPGRLNITLDCGGGAPHSHEMPCDEDLCNAFWDYIWELQKSQPPFEIWSRYSFKTISLANPIENKARESLANYFIDITAIENIRSCIGSTLFSMIFFVSLLLSKYDHYKKQQKQVLVEMKI